MYFPSCFDSNSGSSTYFYFAINTPAALRRLVVVLLVAWPPAITRLHRHHCDCDCTILQCFGLGLEWNTNSSLESSNNERQSVDIIGYYGVIGADALTTSVLAIVLQTEQKCFDIEWRSMSNPQVSYYFQFLLCCAGGYKIFDDLYYVNEEFQKMLNYINTIQTRLFHIFTILQDIIMQTSFGVWTESELAVSKPQRWNRGGRIQHIRNNIIVTIVSSSVL